MHLPTRAANVCRPAPVAQLDRALASEAKGHRFESCRARHTELPGSFAVLRRLRNLQLGPRGAIISAAERDVGGRVSQRCL